MEPPQSKTPRKRVANFTADEKVLLAQLVKKRPIIESKITDGKSVAAKQAAWNLITQEFNSNANVHKRETISLKKAWENMKAFTRKARANERGNLLRTGGGPHAPPPSQHEAIINIVEQAAPEICQIKNSFDSDGTVLHSIDDSQDFKTTSAFTDNSDILEFKIDSLEINIPQIKDEPNCKDYKNAAMIKTTDQVRKPIDYIRREALIRIRHLENKKKIEMEILKTKLEVEQIKKKAALLEAERNRCLLEKAKIELFIYQATPEVICEIKNSFDSDDTALHSLNNSQDFKTTSAFIDNSDILEFKIDSSENTIFEVMETNKSNSPQIKDEPNCKDYSEKKNVAMIKTTDQVRKPIDYIRREAVIRIKHLENKKKIEMEKLKTQLEVEQIKKKAALLEAERNKCLLEKAKIELEEVKKAVTAD